MFEVLGNKENKGHLEFWRKVATRSALASELSRLSRSAHWATLSLGGGCSGAITSVTIARSAVNPSGVDVRVIPA